jgi:hypothetical protein
MEPYSLHSALLLSWAHTALIKSSALSTVWFWTHPHRYIPTYCISINLEQRRQRPSHDGMSPSYIMSWLAASTFEQTPFPSLSTPQTHYHLWQHAGVSVLECDPKTKWHFRMLLVFSGLFPSARWQWLPCKRGLTSTSVIAMSRAHWNIPESMCLLLTAGSNSHTRNVCSIQGSILNGLQVWKWEQGHSQSWIMVREPLIMVDASWVIQGKQRRHSIVRSA